MDGFVCKGYWFLPNKEDNAVAGILTFDENGRCLELIGSLVGSKSGIDSMINADRQKGHSVIHGVTSDAKKVTLLNCYSRGFSHNLSITFPIEKYGCTYIVLGKHINSIDDVVFDEISLRINPLSTWIPPERLQTTFAKEEYISVKINTKEGTNIATTVKLSEKYELILLYGARYSGDHYSPVIEQYSQIRIRSVDSKSPLLELLAQAQLFIDFISMLYNKIAKPLLIELKDDSDYQEIEERKYYKWAELYYNVADNQKEDINAKFLLEYGKIEEEFSSMIEKWYGISKELYPIRSLLIESLQAKSNFTNIDFLIVVQALEGFHRRFVGNKRKSLEDRVRELIDLHNDVKIISCLSIQEKEVADSRNYYSHFYDRKEVQNLVSGRELFLLTQKLKILLTCCLLKFVGMEIKTINKVNWADMYNYD